MNTLSKFSLFLLRISMGWLMLYAGITKILNPQWTSAGYLKGAKTFSWFYQWLAQGSNIGWVDFINEWGLTLLGVSLILGIMVRLSSSLGIILMLLYYFPVLTFPYIKPYSFLIDDHLIYALVLFLFVALRAGRGWGFDSWCAGLPICSKFPKLRALFG